jgi:hypothetical protein
MSDVNFIKNSVAFARHVPIDDRLTPYHISLWYAYFHLWNDERFDNPFRMYRNDVMDLAAIGSTTTFRKCLNDLNQWEYLLYLPSQSKHRPSKIEMHRLDIASPKPFVLWEQQNVKRDSGTDRSRTKRDPDADQNQNKSDPDGDQNQDKSVPGSDTTSDLQVISFNTNSINPPNSIQTRERESAHAPADDLDKITLQPPAAEKKSDPGGEGVPTNLEEVVAYFVSQGSTALEAKKFYYHFEAIHWKVSGQPMANWHAAVQKWFLNTASQAVKAGNRPTPGSLQTPGARDGKKIDYDKPM